MTTTFLYGANVQANGIRQHYLRYGGRGLPVVLLPGITSPAITWGFVAERLGATCDVYVLDARGRGLSEASDAFEYDIAACSEDAIQFAGALKLERYALLGHSFGARIAVKAASRHPPGLDRLVIVDPPVSGPGRRPYPANIAWYLESIRQMQRGGDAELLRPYLPTWTEDQLRLRAEWLHTCDLKAVEDAYNSFHQDDMHADLPKIAVRTLLIAAGKGDVIRPEELEELKRLIPNNQTVVVEAAGHMIPWDDEDGFHSALGRFLDLQPGQAPSQDRGSQ